MLLKGLFSVDVNKPNYMYMEIIKLKVTFLETKALIIFKKVSDGFDIHAHVLYPIIFKIIQKDKMFRTIVSIFKKVQVRGKHYRA